jgi:hypothetical protein
LEGKLEWASEECILNRYPNERLRALPPSPLKLRLERGEEGEGKRRNEVESRRDPSEVCAQHRGKSERRRRRPRSDKSV